MVEKVVSSQRKKILALAIFLAVFFFGLIWAAVVPTGEAPDESEHISLANFIRQQKRIPIFDQEEKLTKMTFTPQLWTEEFRTGAYYSQAYNSPLSYLPFLPFLSNQSLDEKSSMRIISALFVALFGLFLFLSLVNFASRQITSAALATIFITLIPQAIFSAGYVNIEPIALFFSALAFYFLSLMLAGGNRLSNFLFLGLSLGLLALCKANYLVLILFFLLLTTVKIFQAKETMKQKIYNFVLTVIPILTINYWWWIRNLRLYNDPIIVNYIGKKVTGSGPDWFLPPGRAGYNFISIIFQPDFARSTFLGFFAALGRLDIFLPTIFYIIFFLIVILLIVKATISGESKKNKLLIFFILALFAVNLLIFSRKNLIDFSPQGRHLFPMLVPLAWILYLGAIRIKYIAVKISIFVFSLTAAIWALLEVYFKYKAQGVSLRESIAVFSIPMIAIYLLILVATFVVISIKIFRTKNE